MPTKDLTLNVQVTLSGPQIDKLTKEATKKTGKSIVEILSSVATGLLIDQADGGLMIDPTTATRLSEATGKEIERPEDLIPLVEKGLGKKGGSFIVEWVVDPTFIGPLQDLAAQQGTTVEQLVQDGMNYAIGQGWLYAINPGPQPLNVNQEDMEYLKKTLEKKTITGTDVAQFIREMFDSPVAAR